MKLELLEFELSKFELSCNPSRQSSVPKLILLCSTVVSMSRRKIRSKTIIVSRFIFRSLFLTMLYKIASKNNKIVNIISIGIKTKCLPINLFCETFL